MPEVTVAIVGAGIGGVYLTAELGMLGCKLRLHDLDDSRLAEIRTRGGIDVARVNGGPNTGFAAIERVTTDLAAATDRRRCHCRRHRRQRAGNRRGLARA